ncbi:metalloregulator ArsR/SmtB family transcription factor [Fluviibacterium sp. DFM31]|uniref:Metalloregulator ArsR/SmtB family transcription factor n=1 Tax=Meridianimarinicoccus marinus TaxID=3231483 RepID=A0ABV3L776_9RHOB
MQNAQPCFRALSDPTRREILGLLSQGGMTIAEVAENFDITRAAVKKHLTILQEGNLITVETAGRTRVNTLNRSGFAPVIDWFAHFDAFWDDRLDALKAAIEKEYAK